MRNNVNSSLPAEAQKLLVVALATGVFFVAHTLSVSPTKAALAPKVEICHIPPGNPDNFHTIKVSENALSAHLDHGDVIGPCNDVCALLCDDGNACTVDDTGDCESQGCPAEPRSQVDCDDGNQCTQDDCEPATGCVNTIAVGASCDDEAFCTENDACDEDGACKGTPIENCCTGAQDCNPTFCNGNFCGIDNQCDSAPPCIPDDIACTEPFCNEDEQMCGEMPVDALCEDPIDCTVDLCDQVDGCQNTPDDSLCGDGIDCTIDVCDPTSGCSYTDNCEAGTTCNAVTGLCESECVPPPDSGQCVLAPDGLVAWWPFDSDASDIQSGLDGVLLNGAAVAGASGVVSGALSLDGVNGFVEVPDHPALTTPTGLTLDAWVNPTTFTTPAVIVSKYNSTSEVKQISWALARVAFMEGTGPRDHLRFAVCDEVYAQCTTVDTDDPVLTEGCWDFVAATFDVATQEIKIYVNGVDVPTTLIEVGNVTSIANTHIPVQIGAITTFTAGGITNFWHGLIDEVEIYDRALSSSEILGIYSAGASGKCKDDLPQPPCFTALWHKGTSDIPQCVADCDQFADCPPGICELKATYPPFADVVDGCVIDGIESDCQAIDAFARLPLNLTDPSLPLGGGCNNICPPPDSCPCWDGGSRSVPGVTSLTDLWQQRGPDVCDASVPGGDRCQDIRFSDGTTLSRAQCRAPTGVFQTDVRDYPDGPRCLVSGSGISKQENLTRPEYEACLQEHDVFTDGINFSNPASFIYENPMCGLAQL